MHVRRQNNKKISSLVTMAPIENARVEIFLTYLYNKFNKLYKNK